jgi:putative membrane protein
MRKTIETKIFRTTLLTSFAAAICIMSCNSNNGSENNTDQNDPKAVAEEHNDAKFDKAKERDAQFLVDAAEINIEEINLSKLAQSQANAADIKDLAKAMEEDHTKAMKELEALASKKMVTIPTEMTKDAQSAYDELKDKTGSGFDRKYCSMMVDGHKDAVEKFEKASTDSEDYEIKTWAGKMLPALRTHLDHSMTCNDKYKEMPKDNHKVNLTK